MEFYSQETVAFILHIINSFKKRYKAAINRNKDNHLKIYHGDGRRQIGATVFVQGRLSKDYNCFSGHLKNADTVIITSYHTLESRHGPQAVKTWCIKKDRFFDTKAKTIPTDFPQSLKGMFELAVFDEAHYLRNNFSGQTLAYTWLEARFNLLLSATPFFNSIRDFSSYTKLLLPACGRDTAHGNNIPALLTAKPGSSEEQYLCSQEFVNNCVFEKGISDMECAVRLRAVIIHLMVRRIKASEIPFRNGHKIGTDIPPSIRRIKEPEFTPAERNIYRDIELTHRRHLFIKDKDHPGRYR
ncbi:hypothetical protein BO71DRAFT_461603 [Aspergillus ellipticus CBS 707.79]|uniref:Helicase ATP-binding domain-containing protein n=1 Tax=Aspergillus ellipticus CBS 707.79 TaxID=1448320 RepID=A0A319D163_9EURO|nr:hypothetical protein BO71DRAFT_461603 [Aspergillus ellipticus CBS 707.79]